MDFSSIVGKTFTEVENNSDRVLFVEDNGTEYEMSHSQDCCESVCVEDINGDLNDLVGTPILMAVESVSSEDPEGYVNEYSYRDSFTWTFYRVSTIKGTVVIRWYGTSNGYYSERVDFFEVGKRRW